LTASEGAWLRVALAFACWIAASGLSANDAPAEPDSYRIDDYRAPTPSTLKGARVLSDEEAHQIWLAGEAVFVDVLPQAPRPGNLPSEVVWRDKPRFDIPGSVWLPDVGYGNLSDPLEDYFREGLRDATGDNPMKSIVVYCQRDCWMSWNAAKRALAFGFHNVDWYPGGADGWAAAGFPLEARRPQPKP
jgi:PQQ-dependent catabolism-associated CXXCW motif protein